MNTPLYFIFFVKTNAHSIGPRKRYYFAELPSSLSLRDGIIAALTEGITAKDAPYRKEGTDEKSPFLESIEGILRAGRRKAAARGLERRYIFPVEVYKKDGGVLHSDFIGTADEDGAFFSFLQSPSLSKASLSSEAIRREFASFIEALATMTIRKPFFMDCLLASS